MRPPLLSPSCMAALILCLQWAASSRAGGTGRAGPALAARPGPPLTEDKMVAGRAPPSQGRAAPSQGRAAAPALSPQGRGRQAPPAQQRRRESPASPPGSGEMAPRNSKDEGGPMAALVTEVATRLQRKSCQAEQETVPVPGQRRFGDDSAGDSGHGACGCLACHPDLCYYGLVLLCEVTCALVTAVTVIQLLARCATSYRRWRESKRRWPGSASSTVWGAAARLSCAICLQAYEPGEALKVLSCSHIYHRKCIDRWHRAQPGGKTCPLCQRSVTAVALVPLAAPGTKQD